jgi:hypothetical protein
MKSEGLHSRWFVNIPQIDYQRFSQNLGHSLPVQIAKLVPLGKNHQGVSPLGSIVSIFGIAYTFEDFSSLTHASRVESTNLSASPLQTSYDDNGRSFPHVVGIGLESEAENRDYLASDLP